MRVSLNWLNDYVDVTGLDPQDIAEALTNAGLEVESIESVGGRFSGVVVGKVLAVEPHPNADRLRLVEVDLGPLGKNRVVCGAPNVARDMRIAYAQVGAQVIDRKTDGLFELKAATIRGVQSAGMICSLEELGLEAQYTQAEEGIWPLSAYTTDADLGRDLKAVLNLQPDRVLDVTPNANRGDLMSMVGVAREVAALFDRPLKLPEPTYQAPQQAKSPYPIVLSDLSVCRYYAGGELDAVTIGESPDWMKQRLLNAGIRSINNVVDITNYVMLELGQPLHAFDIHKLGDAGTIGVRRAKAGEQLCSLDGITRALAPDSVLITLNDNPVALAGVMGGEDTEIGPETKRVFLESAYFPAASNRKSARSVGLRTESSARFERGVDPAMCEMAFYRAIALLVQHAGARLQSVSIADEREMSAPKLTLSLDRMARCLGVCVPAEAVKRSLMQLGFDVSGNGTSQFLTVTVPTYRAHDVTREIDLIEEAIRIYGYDKVPYTLPLGTQVPAPSLRQHMLNTIRHCLTASGLTEVTTHSLIGDALLHRTGFSQDPESTVGVTNSQSIDHTLLRQSILPNLLDIARENQDQGNNILWFFELGRVYFKRRPATTNDSGVEEPLCLSGLLMGHPTQGEWHQPVQTDFYTLKGVLENLLRQFRLESSCRWLPETERPSFHPGQTAQVKLGKRSLAVLGRLHPLLEESLKFRSPVYLFEMDMEVLYQALQKQPAVIAVESLSAFPSVQRDIAFAAPIWLSHQEILKTMREVNDPLLQGVVLFDAYTGPQVPDGFRSLAYRLTLQSATGTLTEADIEQSMTALKQHLARQLSDITFR